MLGSILLGVAAIPRRNFAQHGDRMLRGYALGMGAGTQPLTLMVGAMILLFQQAPVVDAVALAASSLSLTSHSRVQVDSS